MRLTGPTCGLMLQSNFGKHSAQFNLTVYLILVSYVIPNIIGAWHLVFIAVFEEGSKYHFQFGDGVVCQLTLCLFNTQTFWLFDCCVMCISACEASYWLQQYISSVVIKDYLSVTQNIVYATATIVLLVISSYLKSSIMLCVAEIRTPSNHVVRSRAFYMHSVCISLNSFTIVDSSLLSCRNKGHEVVG